MSYLEVSARLTVRPSCLESFKRQAAECLRITKEQDAHAVRLVSQQRWFTFAHGLKPEPTEVPA